jgi:hypothetical protein
MKKIYGSIGYSILRNNNKNILIFSDMHDKLDECDNKIDISEWLRNKFKTSHILLEEVSRENFNLKEIWPDSNHTQKLKKLFLNNTDKIKPIDIRPFLIPFSLEIWDNDDSDLEDIILGEYLLEIDLFYCLKNKYIKKKIKTYRINKIDNTNIGRHYLNNKKKYHDFLNNHQNLLKLKINEIIKNYNFVIALINNLLDDIMEWYICATIDICKFSHILHTGLAHSEKVISLLIDNYNYQIIKEYGIIKLNNRMDNYENGCVELPNEYDNLFG